MNTDIEQFVKTLLVTNRDYDFFVNWDKATIVENYSVELHALDSLIKCNNFKTAFYDLLKKILSVIKVFPFLIAISAKEIESLMKGTGVLRVFDIETNNIDKYDFSILGDVKLTDEEIDRYYYFFKKIGLFHFFQNIVEKSIYDYCVGIQIGLDSHARKNRSGNSFEKLCFEVIEDIAKRHNYLLLEQTKFSELSKYGFQLSPDVANRICDFILVNNKKAFNIEVNYYNGGGSKPEEIVDSYINRCKNLSEIDMGFGLITDGLCWNNRWKHQLIKAFKGINIMNYYMAKRGVLEKLLEEYFGH